MSLSVCILASTIDIGVSKDILSTHSYDVVGYPCDAAIIVVNKMKLSENEIIRIFILLLFCRMLELYMLFNMLQWYPNSG